VRELSHSALPETPILPSPFHALLLQPLPCRPKAVLFDIYGTLFTSASGDISSVDQRDSTSAVATALDLIGAGPISTKERAALASRFHTEIKRDHRRSESAGVEFPEVDVRKIWRRAATGLAILDGPGMVERFAVCYEMAANPVWPMPGVAALLSRLRDQLPMGIVSNAQFYTPLLFPGLLGRTIDEFGFQPNLVSFSYDHRIAKPDLHLFDRPLAALADQGIDSSKVVYIGNDMLNDVATATAAGCMTVLFAGDRRSLRLREHHPAVGSLAPNSVVQTLKHAGTIVLGPKEKR
ncbi:MAG: HAD family hydrolase, partial [Spirochaetia bacterium]